MNTITKYVIDPKNGDEYIVDRDGYLVLDTNNKYVIHRISNNLRYLYYDKLTPIKDVFSKNIELTAYRPITFNTPIVYEVTTTTSNPPPLNNNSNVGVPILNNGNPNVNEVATAGGSGGAVVPTTPNPVIPGSDTILTNSDTKVKNREGELVNANMKGVKYGSINQARVSFHSIITQQA